MGDPVSKVDRWNERYAASEQLWSVGPNQFVEEFARGLRPGRAVDLAAGEGRNAIWLASRGWEATAVDFSSVAIERGRGAAAAAGVDVEFVEADLTDYEPTPGAFDLVVIAYLHLPASERRAVFAAAARAVAPGGRFFLVGHDLTNLQDGHGGPPDPSVLTTPTEVAEIVSDVLDVGRAEVVERSVQTDDGPKIALDTIVEAARAE